MILAEFLRNHSNEVQCLAVDIFHRQAKNVVGDINEDKLE